MEKILLLYGFVKDGLYNWKNDKFEIIKYYDGLTIQKIDGEDSQILYDGLTPNSNEETQELIERTTKLKKLDDVVSKLLYKTKSGRIFSNTSLNISNSLINYIKFNSTSEDEICKKLNINLEKLKEFMSGSHNFTLSEISQISVLINKTITVK